MVKRVATKYRAKCIITHARAGFKREFSYGRCGILIVHDGRRYRHGDIFGGAGKRCPLFSRNSYVRHVGELAMIALEDESGDNEECQGADDRTKRERGEYK